MSKNAEKPFTNKFERLKLEREFRAFEYAQQKAKTDQRITLMRREIEEREHKIAEIMISLKDSFEKISAGKGASKLTQQQMLKRLQNYAVLEKQVTQAISVFGLESIPALGQEVDPALHFVESTVADKTKPDGTIVKVNESGYTINGRVIRPARIVAVKNQ